MKQILLLISATSLSFLAILIEMGKERIFTVSWEEPLLILITLLFAFGWIMISKLVKQLDQNENIIAGLGFLITGLISMILALRYETIKFTYNWQSLTLFVALILLGDIIFTRSRARLSKQYTQTMLAFMNIFTPFIVAINEIVTGQKNYSPKLFIILIPSMACFFFFYLLEDKSQVSEQ